MKRKKKNYFLVIGLCLIGILAGIFGWTIYHKTRPELNSVKADVQISAVQLSNEFRSDENIANKKYLNKIIEVGGIVSTLQQNNQQAIIELQGADGAMGGVNCEMRSQKNLPQKGDSVRIKGRCTGYLMDVSLVDAVISQ